MQLHAKPVQRNRQMWAKGLRKGLNNALGSTEGNVKEILQSEILPESRAMYEIVGKFWLIVILDEFLQ